MSGHLVLFARCVLASSLVATAAAAQPQKVLVQSYTELDGMPSSRVLDIRSSPSGLPWFALRSGLFEYDGTTWQPMLQGLLSPGRAVRFVRFDLADDAWVLCEDGDIVSTSAHAPVSPAHLRVSRSEGFLVDFALMETPDGPSPCVTTSLGGLRVFSGGAWTTPDLGGAEAVAVAVENCFGRVFVGSYSGLRILDPGVVTTPASFPPIPPGPVRGLHAETGPGGPLLWIFGSDWIGTLGARGGFELMVAGLPSLDTPDRSPVTLVPDGRGGVLYGNPWAIYHVSAGTRVARLLDSRSGLPVAGVNAFTRDDFGMIWGASDLAAFKLISVDATIRTSAHGLLADEVTAVAESPEGRIVLGHQGGLTWIDGDVSSTLPFEHVDPNLPASTRVMDLCFDRDGALLIAAAGLGVGRLGPDGVLDWTAVPEALGGWANAVCPDGTGGALVGTPTGLARFEDDRFEPVEGKADIPFVRRIVRDRSGRTILATTTGLWIGREGAWKCLRSKLEQDGFEHFFTCLEDQQGRLWCGGSDGLWMVEGDNLIRVESTHDIRRPVYSLTEDDRGRLWIGTDLGFMLLDEERLIPLDWIGEHTGYETNRAAAWTDRRGNVWMGTSHGVTVFEPAFEVPSTAPELELLEVHIGGRVLEPLQAARVSAARSDLVVRARSRCLIFGDRLEFRSRIFGFTEWETTRGGTVFEARYTGLPSGRYRFEIQARVPGGDYSSIVSSPELIVLGPLWTRPWFLALMIGATAIASVTGYRSLLLSRHAARLESEVAQRTRELQGSLQELAKTDSLRALGLLGGGVAHDLRNLLTVVMANLSLLRARLETDPSDSACLRSIDAALDRANQLAAQLQTFATGGAPVTNATSLSELVNESGRIVMAGSPVSLELALDADLWPAEADTGQIRQVIENLLLNARQCQPRGGWIRVQAKNVTIEDAPAMGASDSLAAGRYVSIVVSDGGPGMPQEVAERALEPFFSTREGGSGIGLATASSIVNRHRGRLTFETLVGGGTSFEFLLPASEQELAPRTDAGEPALAGGGWRVLVVDDEKAICTVLSAMLEGLGFEAQAAAGKEEALRLARRARLGGRPFQVAILDLTLPGDSPGPEILMSLRREEPDLYAIASSGYCDDDVLARPAEYGFQATLPKPYRVDDLRGVMAAIRCAPSPAQEGDRRATGSRPRSPEYS